ncbi:MAG: HD domain-containing protein [Desulfomicrobium sp.]|jgi:3'-5' exoribonuclease|nr:HD domain-containing protein [Desulfomicrobium sp.]NLV95818.1 HD domain-containing protein [Desulfovibrionales bacterium]
MTQKKSFITDLVANQNISDYFALAQAQRREAKNGPYWQLTLADRTGTMEARIWYPQSLHYENLKAEQFVHITGQVALFKDQIQMNIAELRVIDNADHGLCLTDFLPSSSIPPQELYTELQNFLNTELTYTPWKNLCHNIFADENMRTALINAPGAKSIHHAYAGGLVEHTLAIMKICKVLAELYPQVDKEILLVAALCHDLGKAFELSQGISREYTDEGRLLGHILIGLEKLEPFLHQTPDLPHELILHLKHIIISHHGELEFGSPRRPKTVEAFILHFADNLDAKINTVQNAVSEQPEQERQFGQWSEFHRVLGRYLYQPMRTPKQKSQKQKRNQKRSDQQWAEASEPLDQPSDEPKKSKTDKTKIPVLPGF